MWWIVFPHIHAGLAWHKSGICRSKFQPEDYRVIQSWLSCHSLPPGESYGQIRYCIHRQSFLHLEQNLVSNDEPANYSSQATYFKLPNQLNSFEEALKADDSLDVTMPLHITTLLQMITIRICIMCEISGICKPYAFHCLY